VETCPEPAQESSIQDLNPGSSVFVFGDVKLGGLILACKPIYLGFGMINYAGKVRNDCLSIRFFRHSHHRQQLFFKNVSSEKTFLKKVNIGNINLQLNLGY
jgi:hypothetical protein